MSGALVNTAPKFCQNGDIYPDRRHFMFWNKVEVMLTLVSLDKLQNIRTLVPKRSKAEGRTF